MVVAEVRPLHAHGLVVRDDPNALLAPLGQEFVGQLRSVPAQVDVVGGADDVMVLKRGVADGVGALADGDGVAVIEVGEPQNSRRDSAASRPLGWRLPRQPWFIGALHIQ